MTAIKSQRNSIKLSVFIIWQMCDVSQMVFVLLFDVLISVISTMFKHVSYAFISNINESYEFRCRFLFYTLTGFGYFFFTYFLTKKGLWWYHGIMMVSDDNTTVPEYNHRIHLSWYLHLIRHRKLWYYHHVWRKHGITVVSRTKTMVIPWSFFVRVL